jgi:peptidyl-prolyl cis-trans isomerase A (cyclophilin A)
MAVLIKIFACGMLRTARHTGLLLALLLAGMAPAQANTLVRISTSFGDFTLELFDDVAPVTVRNFLNYVNRGAYNGTYFHRLEAGFVLQGGGFRIVPFVGPIQVPADPPIVNEYNIANTRGTVAMAKFGGDPNSATSEWFVNLADNSATLNTQNNGGFTVFGRVLGDGMIVMDAIGVLPVYALGTSQTQIPLHGDDGTTPLSVNNFVTMNAEIVQRYSSSLAVFESQSGLLVASVDGGTTLGAYSVNLSLQRQLPGTVFRLNPDSLVRLAIRPIGMATYADNKLRIPSLEVNENGNVRVLTNVVLTLTDAVNWLFTLESFQP